MASLARGALVPVEPGLHKDGADRPQDLVLRPPFGPGFDGEHESAVIGGTYRCIALDVAVTRR
jgi:hypothetical protein